MKNTSLILLVLLLSLSSAFASVDVTDLNCVKLDGDPSGNIETIMYNWASKRAALGTALIALMGTDPVEQGGRALSVCNKWNISVPQNVIDTMNAAIAADQAVKAAEAAKKAQDQLDLMFPH